MLGLNEKSLSHLVFLFGCVAFSVRGNVLGELSVNISVHNIVGVLVAVTVKIDC
jgi:hypothetical protein